MKYKYNLKKKLQNQECVACFFVYVSLISKWSKKSNMAARNQNKPTLPNGYIEKLSCRFENFPLEFCGSIDGLSYQPVNFCIIQMIRNRMNLKKIINMV